VTLYNSDLTKECLIAIVRGTPGLQSFSTDAHGATESFLMELALSCHGLTKLSLQSLRPTLTSLHAVLERSAGLCSLGLYRCGLQEPKIRCTLSLETAACVS
jgi:hypothetical protein